MNPLPATDDLLNAVTDPVERLLLSGRAGSVFEAEQIYLDEAYPEALALLAGPATEWELADHPLFRLYRSCGSPGREDSLT